MNLVVSMRGLQQKLEGRNQVLHDQRGSMARL